MSALEILASHFYGFNLNYLSDRMQYVSETDTYETDGHARRLALGCKFWISVSRRVFRVKRQYFMPPRSRLGFREETQNYAKRNRSQIFLKFMTILLKTPFRQKHSMIMSLYH